ncbi:unnamed protein product [Prunus armeniaca]
MAATAVSSVHNRSQAFYHKFENICREGQGSVKGNILAPWVDDEAPLEFHLLGPRLKGGMPQGLVNPSEGQDGRPFFFP